MRLNKSIQSKMATDGQFYFTVNARNGQVLVTSETYKRKANMFKGIKSLLKAIKKWEKDNI